MCGLAFRCKFKSKYLPGKVDSGIIFKRVDLNQNNLILANFKNVSSAKLCTTSENDHGVKVSTVEYLLAALYWGSRQCYNWNKRSGNANYGRII